jgi:hypothetical protein
MTDPTKLRVVARGNHRDGYRGVIEIGFHAVLIPFDCGHRHPATSEARDCIRKKVWRLLDASEMDRDWHEVHKPAVLAAIGRRLTP